MSKEIETATDRKYLIERVDDAAVAQVYADGFNELPLEQKLLIWHLYNAALAGRDIGRGDAAHRLLGGQGGTSV